MKFIYHGNLESLKNTIHTNASTLHRNIFTAQPEHISDTLYISFQNLGYEGDCRCFVAHIQEENGYTVLTGKVQIIYAHPSTSKNYIRLPQSRIEKLFYMWGFIMIGLMIVSIPQTIQLFIVHFKYLWLPFVLIALSILTGWLFYRNKQKKIFLKFVEFMSIFTQVIE